MDRVSLRNFTHNASAFLTMDSSNYKQWVFRYTFLELEKDLGSKGDVTSLLVLPDSKMIKASIVAKSDGVFAGLEEIKYFLVDSDKSFRPRVNGDFLLNFRFNDGDFFNKGDVLIDIEAEAHDLLAVERVVLNLLMRMSSVATFAKKAVDLLKDCDVLIVPTRKTLWGLLDKKAVVIGGGGTHRLNLSDAVLVKDTHVKLMDSDFERILSGIVEKDQDLRFVEIEVESVDATLSAAKAFDSVDLRIVGALLFDNMTPDKIEDALRVIKSEGLDERLLFEASGGINLANVASYAKTGVDIISMGCLTAGVPNVDMSLKVL